MLPIFLYECPKPLEQVHLEMTIFFKTTIFYYILLYVKRKKK